MKNACHIKGCVLIVRRCDGIEGQSVDGEVLVKYVSVMFCKGTVERGDDGS